MRRLSSAECTPRPLKVLIVRRKEDLTRVCTTKRRAPVDRIRLQVKTELTQERVFDQVDFTAMSCKEP